MDAGFVPLLVVLGLFGLVALRLLLLRREDRIARTTFYTTVPATPEQVEQILQQRLRGILWTQALGPGQINVRRRSLNFDGWVLSVDFESTESGGTKVSAWLSSFETYLKLAYKVDAKAPQKILRKIEEDVHEQKAST